MLDHPDFEAPPDESVIWRYVDLEKLLAMLASRQLHLTRLDTLKDTWEGHWPKSVIEKAATQLVNVNDVVQLTTPMVRSEVYVNCWHVSDYESAALWDQYASSAGFAIKSTVRALRESIAPSEGLIIGAVTYVHFDAE